MERLSSRDLVAVIEVAAEVHASEGSDEFVNVALHALRRLVPADIVSYNEFDAAQGHAFVLAEPREVLFPGSREILANHMDENPLIAHFLATHDPRALTLSDFLNKRGLHRTELYQQLYRPIGAEFLLAMSLRTSGSILIGTGLMRANRDFSARDRAVLELFTPHLAAARANAEARGVLSRLQSLLADEGRAFLLLGWDGRIGQSTPHGRDLLHEFFEDGRQMDKPSLPEALRDRLHQRLTGDGNALPQDSFPLTVERGGKKLRATLTESGDPTMPLMLELEELPAKLSAATLRPLGLSRRQSEVLALVATGATNNEIAVLLNVSPRTVKKHLEHIYDRLGVRTRTSAATIALQARHH